jgi:hypothetical protein
LIAANCTLAAVNHEFVSKEKKDSIQTKLAIDNFILHYETLILGKSRGISNGDMVKRTFNFKEATCSKEVMLRRLQCYLERARFTSLIEKMTLTLTDLCSEEGKQASFLDTQVKHWAKLITAINQLQQRYGQGIVKQVLHKEGRLLPEDSFSFANFDIKKT